MKTILCYGDSNTFGQIAGGNERFSRNERWPGRLQMALGEEYHVIEEGLSGRTTVWDDPVEEHKNGKAYLAPCLGSHKPLDLVILLLGTNDLKKRFSVSSFEISVSIERLLDTILKSETGREEKAPEILLITPVPVRDVGHVEFNMMFEDGFKKGHQLGRYYKALARRKGVHYLEPGEQIELDDADGVHYTAKGHADMAKLIEKEVIRILG